MDMQQCVGCRFVKYCCKKCQKTGWKAHRASCPAIAALFAGKKLDKEVYYGILDAAEYHRWSEALRAGPNVLDPRAKAMTRTFRMADENGVVRDIH